MRHQNSDTVTAEGYGEPKRRRIATKLFFAAVVLGFVLTLLSAALQFALDYRAELRSIDTLIEEIEGSYLPALSRSLFNFDLEQTQLLIEGIYLADPVAFVSVEERQDDGYVSRTSVGRRIPEDTIRHTLPLVISLDGEEREIGRLTIYNDLRVLRQRLFARAGQLVLTSGVQVFGVALLLLLVIRGAVVKHLRATAEFLGNVDLPQPREETLRLDRAKLPFSRRDEIDDIATAINDMTRRLSHTYRELEETRDRLSYSLAEKETLIRELYHRTKNNMQVIMSMLSLQSAELPQSDNVDELVTETKGRIYAMALVHEKLYRSNDLSRIDIAEYLTDLSRYIMQSNGSEVELRLDLEPQKLLFDAAVPVGLVVNELTHNTLEHAFPDGRAADGTAPRLTLTLRRTGGGELILEVTDNGVGLPEGFDPRRAGSMGLDSVYAVAEHQLGGSVAVHQEEGLTWRLTFPDSLYAERV